ncbi:hypothetical protein HFO60_27570 [Rhizobium leguminosarum]|uniref:hypothetical protein n=1 Tax=Rhizobium leguminosarum TaxID=384 RepID=UPI001C950721|nr:hypothetical protein [Rhizobium leguminosarum]MBY5523504.1 hypothetical protein [Rhizobium leguminosarum]MBY5543725.1 hypothetical protein [Rhizobium leguminosarum]
MTKDQELFSLFRRAGSRGLVVFERDGLLLRRRDPSNHLTLGDIDEDFVDMLRRLRELNFRFGFISDQRGMGAGSYGRSEFAALTRVLDELLSIHEAIPDFWMAWDSLSRAGIEAKHQDDHRLMSEVGMIQRATSWYDVDSRNAVFVGNSSRGMQAAKQAKIPGIRYSGWRNDKAREIQRLRDAIERILSPGHRRTA